LRGPGVTVTDFSPSRVLGQKWVDTLRQRRREKGKKRERGKRKEAAQLPFQPIYLPVLGV